METWSTSDLFTYMAAVGPLTYVVARAPRVWRSGQSRTVWWLFVMLSASLLVRIGSVSTAMYEATSIPNFGVLTKSLTTIAATSCMVRWVVRTSPRRHADYHLNLVYRFVRSKYPWITTTTAISVIVLFPLCQAGQRNIDDSQFILAQGGHYGGSLDLLVLYAFMAYGMGSAALLSLDAWDRDRRGIMGSGMALVALGCGLGVLYALWRAVYLVEALFNMSFPGGDGAMILFSQVFEIASMLFLSFGMVLPLWQRFERSLQDHRVVVDLRPLWDLITEAVPNAAYASAHWLQDAIDPRGSGGRLTARVTEIRDGAGELAQYVSQDTACRVRVVVEALEIPNSQAVVDAYLVREASRNRRKGQPRVNDPVPTLLTFGDDLMEDIHFLSRVARALETSDLLRVERTLPTLPPATVTA